ncbi:MAG: hypothetical protein FWF59_07620 [Turicibacter sp.]|nr:hypothetical protein [Turicibacter sp.]
MGLTLDFFDTEETPETLWKVEKFLAVLYRLQDLGGGQNGKHGVSFSWTPPSTESSLLTTAGSILF